MGARDAAEAVSMTLCGDQLVSPLPVDQVTPAVTARLDAWWTVVMGGPDPLMSPSLYLTMLVR